MNKNKTKLDKAYDKLKLDMDNLEKDCDDLKLELEHNSEVNGYAWNELDKSMSELDKSMKDFFNK